MLYYRLQTLSRWSDIDSINPLNPFQLLLKTHHLFIAIEMIKVKSRVTGIGGDVGNAALSILEDTIPTDKIVYEESVQESLGCESNQLTFDSLTSIKDMLECKDDNTVSAGLKSLSMMDWVHYPNSIKYILNLIENYGWRYNPAASSTSVKYMLKTISKNSSRRHWPGCMDYEIYEQDYELFKQLKMHYDKIAPEKILDYMRYMDFMTVDQGQIVPNLR